MLTLYLYNIVVVVSVVLINPKDPTVSFFVAVSIAGSLIAIPFPNKSERPKQVTIVNEKIKFSYNRWFDLGLIAIN